MSRVPPCPAYKPKSQACQMKLASNWWTTAHPSCDKSHLFMAQVQTLQLFGGSLPSGGPLPAIVSLVKSGLSLHQRLQRCLVARRGLLRAGLGAGSCATAWLLSQPGSELHRCHQRKDDRGRKGRGLCAGDLPQWQRFYEFWELIYGSVSKPCAPDEHQNSW